MEMQWTGPILAVTTVLTIWTGHELVRKVNYHLGTWPAIPLYIIGIGVLSGSLFVSSDILSGVLGIVGLTVLVDGYEVVRQEARIRKGHAPENPKRPVRRTSI